MAILSTRDGSQNIKSGIFSARGGSRANTDMTSTTFLKSPHLTVDLKNGGGQEDVQMATIQMKMLNLDATNIQTGGALSSRG